MGNKGTKLYMNINRTICQLHGRQIIKKLIRIKIARIVLEIISFLTDVVSLHCLQVMLVQLLQGVKELLNLRYKYINISCIYSDDNYYWHQTLPTEFSWLFIDIDIHTKWSFRPMFNLQFSSNCSDHCFTLDKSS